MAKDYQEEGGIRDNSENSGMIDVYSETMLKKKDEFYT